MRRVLAVAALLAVCGPALARADDASGDSDDEPPASHQFSWADAVGDGSSDFRRTMDGGDAIAMLVSEGRADVHDVIKAYQRAVRLRPGSAEAHYRLAETVYYYFIAPVDTVRPHARKTRLALRHWADFERLAPLDPRLADVLFQESLTYTKQVTDAGFRKGIEIYDHLIALSSGDAVDPTTLRVYLGNRAELHMMLGQLDDAIAYYSRALEQGNQSWLGYGLAVALDRDGQRAKAREVMRENLFNDRNMSRLSQEGTFFVPAGEKNYYLALGYEVLGDYPRAIEHYKAFIRSGAHPRFQPRARENIARLEGKPSRLHPSPSRYGPSYESVRRH